MPYRITESDLYAAVRRLNDTAGMGVQANGTNQPGAYYLQGAYGGWQLQRNRLDGRGCESITDGYIRKPALYDLIHAVIRGYESAQRDRHAQVFGVNAEYDSSRT
jgi:hypothetical protein